MYIKRLLAVWLSGAVVVSSIGGCGSSGAERGAVSGTVTIDGMPIEMGQVVFEPKGTGRMGIGQIADGHYTIPQQHGLASGEYVVRITAERPTGEKVTPSSYSADKTPQDVYEQFIPTKYNSESELTTTIDGTSSVEQNFALTLK